MMDTVALKVHRHSDDQIQLQEKIGDLDTKVILLCQAAKNSIDGKDNSHMFDGIGDVVSAVDHFKDMIKTQYAKLSEFKETEKQVEYLNNFYMESQKQKRQEHKDREEVLEKFQDLKIATNRLSNEVTNIKNEKLRMLENQLIEKVDFSDFENTISNIQNYIENLNIEESSPSLSPSNQIRGKEASTFVIKAMETQVDRSNNDNSMGSEDIEETLKGMKFTEQSQVSTPIESRNQTPQTTKNLATSKPKGRVAIKVASRESSPTLPKFMKQNSLKKKKTMKKATGFIPREVVRMKEFERKVKDMDEKLTNILKTSKNDLIPIIEKRLNGIREELENKASTLDVKRLIPEVNLASETNKKIREEMQNIREEGLIGDKGRKAEENINFTMSRVSQLEGKFTWMHNSHKDLTKKMHENMSASQPLMLNNNDGGTMVNEAIMIEVRKDMEKLQKEINSTSSTLRVNVNDLKAKLNDKIDERTLNELEDQITTDIDQTIRSKSYIIT